MPVEPWPVRVLAETHARNGRPVRMDRTLEGGGDVEAAMLRALSARKDKGAPFIGCTITALTPLGQKVIRVLEQDWNGLRLEALHFKSVHHWPPNTCPNEHVGRTFCPFCGTGWR